MERSLTFFVSGLMAPERLAESAEQYDIRSFTQRSGTIYRGQTRRFLPHGQLRFLNVLLSPRKHVAKIAIRRRGFLSTEVRSRSFPTFLDNASIHKQRKLSLQAGWRSPQPIPDRSGSLVFGAELHFSL